MRYNPPFGSTDSNASYVNGTPTSKGSVIPASAIEDPQREIINAITALGLVPSGSDNAQLAKAIRTMSFQYNATVDYDKPRPVIGSDNLLYLWKQANGPSTIVVNPVNDTNEVYWTKYNPSPEIPATTDTDAGLVKLSDSIESELNASSGETAASPYAVKQLHDIIVTLEYVMAEFQKQLILESDVITRYQISTNDLLRYILSRVNNINAGTTLITTPIITSPVSGSSMEIGDSLTVSSSAFACAISASHTSSDWKICTDNFGNSVVTQVTASTTNKTSITFPSTDFESISESRTLYVFVRYNDSTLGYSYWSDPIEILFDAHDESEGESGDESLGDESLGEESLGDESIGE